MLRLVGRRIAFGSSVKAFFAKIGALRAVPTAGDLGGVP
jgi:hypothetical protein